MEGRHCNCASPFRVRLAQRKRGSGVLRLKAGSDGTRTQAGMTPNSDDTDGPIHMRFGFTAADGLMHRGFGFAAIVGLVHMRPGFTAADGLIRIFAARFYRRCWLDSWLRRITNSGLFGPEFAIAKSPMRIGGSCFAARSARRQVTARRPPLPPLYPGKKESAALPFFFLGGRRGQGQTKRTLYSGAKNECTWKI